MYLLLVRPNEMDALLRFDFMTVIASTMYHWKASTTATTLARYYSIIWMMDG